MKLNLFIAAVIIFSVAANAQKYITTEKVINIKLCDTCRVYEIYNPEKPLSYMIIGAREVGIEGSFAKNSGEQLPFVSTYFTPSSEFSLDFMRVSMLMKDTFNPYVLAEPTKKVFLGNKLKQLQYMVLQNNKILKNWTGVSTLANDKDFSVGVHDNDKNDRNFLPIETYHAGRFKLNINDSLVILIKDTVLKQIVEPIFIGRVIYFPRLFDVIKFSSDADLQDVLNNKINKVKTQAIYHKDSVDNFEMQPDETVLFKFERFEIINGGLEYAFVEDNVKWNPVTINDSASQNFAFIAINKPAPGKTIELLLRYKQQPESVHRIIIKVHEKLTSTTFFKVAVTFLIAALLFAIWYAFKRRNHLKQLKQLTRNKEEIESKLQLLSGQLNPHFLFNSLNSVQNLINKNEPENANLYVSEVSSFLRTIMDAGKKEYISLEEELSMEAAYIKLEQKRKAFNYNVINNCSTKLSLIEFPPSLLQPIIENSIHHGFSRIIENPLITIGIACNEKQLVVSVTDNGQGFDEALIKPGHGLAIVQKRISLMNEKPNGMPIEMKVEPTDKGTVTTFTFQNWL